MWQSHSCHSTIATMMKEKHGIDRKKRYQPPGPTRQAANLRKGNQGNAKGVASKNHIVEPHTTILQGPLPLITTGQSLQTLKPYPSQRSSPKTRAQRPDCPIGQQNFIVLLVVMILSVRGTDARIPEEQGVEEEVTSKAKLSNKVSRLYRCSSPIVLSQDVCVQSFSEG
jgi:hypothetical protein